jgi:hypothetical protein
MNDVIIHHSVTQKSKMVNGLRVTQPLKKVFVPGSPLPRVINGTVRHMQAGKADSAFV